MSLPWAARGLKIANADKSSAQVKALIVDHRRGRSRRPRLRCSSTWWTAASWPAVLRRLAYLSMTNTFSLIRLLPMSDRDKKIEILVLRRQLTVLQRQVDKAQVEAAVHVQPEPAVGVHVRPEQRRQRPPVHSGEREQRSVSRRPSGDRFMPGVVSDPRERWGASARATCRRLTARSI
ncbi:hypothetical protein ABZS88_35280 [Streptomyces sp. NPDC005480]|uniref:hypothetical protein n=1 Tax=Streptomyces sp. NPDC005480 TaxID=3154880 RepID=UPI0033BA330C